MNYLKSFLCVSILALTFACTTHKSTTTMNLLIGTYTDTDSEGIYTVVFDPDNGSLSEPQLLAASDNPSYLVINDDRTLVYAVNENKEGSVSAFNYKGDTALTLINKVSTFGAHPCYVDWQDGVVAIANYSSGNGGIFRTGTNGSLKKGLSEFQHFGSSKNPERQGAPHAHFSRFSEDGTLLYVIDLGIDQIMSYPVVDGKIGAAKTAMTLQRGDGPRHLVFHPSQQFVYIISELSNTITAATVNGETGAFTEFSRVSTLPEGHEADSYCADIHISQDGRFLYASNRGHNSIAIFAIAENGELSMVGTESTRGDWPRNFTLSPDDGFLLVANQNSDNIVVFERDEDTGLLKFTGFEVKVSKPVCLKF